MWTRERENIRPWNVGLWTWEARTRGRGDVMTHFYYLFNFSSYFTKSSSFDRNCIVRRFQRLGKGK